MTALTPAQLRLLAVIAAAGDRGMPSHRVPGQIDSRCKLRALDLIEIYLDPKRTIHHFHHYRATAAGRKLLEEKG